MFDNLINPIKAIIADVRKEIASPSFEDAADALSHMKDLILAGRDTINSLFGLKMRGPRPELTPEKVADACAKLENACHGGMKADAGGALGPILIDALTTLLQALVKKYFPNLFTAPAC